MSHRNAASRHVDPAAVVPAVVRDRPAADDEDSDSSSADESVDMLTFAIDTMNEMTVAERRRVYALKGLYAEYKTLRTRLHDEVVELQRKQHEAAQRLYELRRAIVCGERDVTPEEVAALGGGGGDDDGSAGQQAGDATAAAAAAKKKKKGGGVQVVSPGDAAHAQALAQAAASVSGGIPGFWLSALRHSDVFSNAITERDAAVLQHLRDITVDYVDADPRKGVVLTFTFAPNEHFTNTTLTKTYHMAYDEDDDDVAVTHVRGCDVAWTSPQKNVTVRVKHVKQRNKRTKQVRVVDREEKCESFFHFFAPLKDPDAASSAASSSSNGGHKDAEKRKKNGDGEDDDDDVDYEQETQMDIEAGQALMEEIVPKAAYYYTGKSVEEIAKQLSMQYGFDNDDEDEDDEDDDEDDEPAPTRGGGAHKKAAVAAGGAKAQQKPEECKQQ